MKIITISREFGSGGRELGKRLSEALGFAYYDDEILTAIAQHSDQCDCCSHTEKPQQNALKTFKHVPPLRRPADGPSAFSLNMDTCFTGPANAENESKTIVRFSYSSAV